MKVQPSEKPLTHTVYEARMLTEAARKYNLATQMGNQRQAEEGPRRLQEMIHDGVIGPIQDTVRSGLMLVKVVNLLLLISTGQVH